MSKSFTIIKREFLEKVKSKYFLFATILGPVLMILLSIAPIFFMKMSEQTSVKMLIIDRTELLQQDIEKNMSDRLSDGQKRFILEFTDFSEYQTNENKYRKQLDEGKLHSIIIIPEDILKSNQAEYISKSLGNLEFINKISERLRDVVGKYRMHESGLDPDRIKKLMAPVELRTVKVKKDGEKKEQTLGQDFITAYIFVFILYMTTLFYSNSILSGVLEEKTSRVVEVLLSSCSSFDLMMGKLFGVGSVGLFQFFIWTILGGAGFMYSSKVFPEIDKMINIPGSLIGYFVLFFVIGFFQYSTLFLIAGSLSSSQEDAKQLATPVTMAIVVPFVLSFMAIKSPSILIVKILSNIPFFNPMIMFVRVAVGSPSMLEILGATLINIVAIFLLIFVCSKIYRTGILMYGKRPGVKEVLKWMKYS